MNETILGKRKTAASEPLRLPPRLPCDEVLEDNELDGFEELDQQAPDLHGIDGASFSVLSFIDIKSLA